MPFCASCGSPADGRFCPKCGTPIPVTGAAAPPPPANAYVPPANPYTPPANPYTPPANPYAPAVVSAPMADNIACTLCYIPFAGLVISIVFLLIAPYNTNRTVRFHAFQSLLLSVAVIAIEIIFHIFFNIMIAIFGFFGLLTAIIWPIFGLACFVLWLYLLFSTFQGKTVVVPVIGPIAQKQAQQ